MQKYFSVLIGLTMLVVAGVVVQQSGLMPISLQGFLFTMEEPESEDPSMETEIVDETTSPSSAGCSSNEFSCPGEPQTGEAYICCKMATSETDPGEWCTEDGRCVPDESISSST